LKKKPINPVDSIDFQGLWQIVQRPFVLVLDSSAQNAQTTRMELDKNFFYEKNDEDCSRPEISRLWNRVVPIWAKSNSAPGAKSPPDLVADADALLARSVTQVNSALLAAAGSALSPPPPSVLNTSTGTIWLSTASGFPPPPLQRQQRRRIHHRRPAGPRQKT
jgi:hypothetical protein